ncbi:MAG TPA: methylated-DNA--[protein]-cysteine S-methyltransferase [Acidimicrobiales bacterium]|nr:methylated-DNA--[protein]-cysteine S-methyltransferase [Acidimicrobiales bacterium]
MAIATLPRTYTSVGSPLGPLLLVGDDQGLAGLYLASHERCRPPEPGWTEDASALAGTALQLEEYFAGTRTTFDVELDLVGTPFQVEVWTALCAIPYGETISYAELARRIGRPAAVRAVGSANGRNPVSIIVPCHRVIGADGRLTGYGWGTERKAWLLDHERPTLG